MKRENSLLDLYLLGRDSLVLQKHAWDVEQKAQCGSDVVSLCGSVVQHINWPRVYKALGSSHGYKTLF